MNSDALTPFFTAPSFSLTQGEKEARLLPLLQELTAHHRNACPAYGRMIDLAFAKQAQAKTLADIPYLPVSLFKYRTLRSVPAQDIRVTVQSSGTTGDQKSRIVLDAQNAQLTSNALSSTLRTLLGDKRMPMLIIDAPSTLRIAGGMGARSAAILGLMPFGRDHTFALRDDLSVDEQAVLAFLARHKGDPILIYGFTFLVWSALLPFLEQTNADLSQATLLHSGGWKHLADHSVDNALFKTLLNKASGLARIVNFYGMAEMPGVIMAENENGLLYPPSFADVIIRDPKTFAPLPNGKKGVVQILSLLPRSFPGHALLTEDMGVIESVDEGAAGWMGKGLRILGRAPKAPLRGCSDVIAREK